MWGWFKTWSGLGLPSMSPCFADMRVVQAGLAREAAGLDARNLDEHDLWGRPMNYPKAWLILAKVFFLHNETAFLFFCGASVLFFWAACAQVIYHYPSLYSLAFPFSFASLLAVERGNTDLVLVGPLFFSLSHSALAGALVVILGTVLKIYPCFSAAALVSRPRVFLVSVILAGFYLLWQAPDIRLLKSLTPESGWWSYGVASTSLALEPKLKILISPCLVQGVLLAMAAWFLFQIRRNPLIGDSTASSQEKGLFLAGAGIYSGTFFLLPTGITG